MDLRSLASTLFLLAAVNLPGHAQEPGVTRERFAYLGSTLEIKVLTEAPGTLRLIHGQPGEIDVSARAIGGMASVGLSGGDTGSLNLTAVSGERVEYLVVVPEDVRVRILLPDRPVAEVFGARKSAETYSWNATHQDP